MNYRIMQDAKRVYRSWLVSLAWNCGVPAKEGNGAEKEWRDRLEATVELRGAEVPS